MHPPLRWLVVLFLGTLLTAPVFSQTVPSLSVSATADSLTVRIGDDTFVVPRDALALLSSPEGHEHALSLHVALLHGTIIQDDQPIPEEDPTPEENPAPEGDPTDPGSPVLTSSAPLALIASDAQRSTGSEGHTWEDVVLSGEPVVQMLPDTGTDYGRTEGPVLSWPIQVEDPNEYYVYVHAAGVRSGNDLWAGTADDVDGLLMTKRQKLLWRRVGPFSLTTGPEAIEVRGRRDGAYFAAVVVSTRADLTDAELDAVLSSAPIPGTGLRRTDLSSANKSRSGASLPTSFALHPAYPNPTRDRSTVKIDLPEAAEVQLDLYDTAGRRVGEQRVTLEAGFGHALNVDTATLSSGVYILRVVARTVGGDTMGTHQLTVVR